MATQSDQTNTGVITTIVVVGSFAMISISAMVTAMVRSQHAEVDTERPTNADLDTVAALDKSQLEHLTAAPAWVGEKGGKVHIPIDRAMNAVIAEYKKKPEAASPPPPPGVVMPPSAPGPTPAAPGTPGAPAAGTPAPGAPAGAAAPAPGAPAPGTQQPTPATPSVAKPNAAAPAPAATPRVVPPPSAPGPTPTPPPTRRP
jgi:hypothetical protein